MSGVSFATLCCVVRKASGYIFVVLPSDLSLLSLRVVVPCV